MRAMRDLEVRAKSVRAQLEPYRKAADPLAALDKRPPNGEYPLKQ